MQVQEAREYLDWYYECHSKAEKSFEVKDITVGTGNQIQGHLDLSDFSSLEKIDCVMNGITSINISNCPKLHIIELWSNNIHQDLSIFSHLTYLEKLDLGQTKKKVNDFYGSLKSLKNCKELKYLCIGHNEKITEGLKFLPAENLHWFGCHGTVFQEILKPHAYNVKYWQFTQKNNITGLPSEELKKDLKRELELKSIIFHNHSTKAEAEQELIHLQEKIYGSEKEEVSSEYTTLSEIAPSEEERGSSFPIFKCLGVFSLGIVFALIFLWKSKILSNKWRWRKS